MSITAYLHISLEFWGCFFCVIAGVTIALGKSSDELAKRFLYSMQFGNALLVLSDAFAWLYRGNISREGYYIVRISNFLVFFTSYAIILLFTGYVSRFVDMKRFATRAALYSVGFITLCAEVFLIISQFTNIFYYFDQTNRYQRSSLFWVTQAVGVVCMVIDSIVIIANRKRISRGNLCVLLSFMVLPMIALIIQVFVYGYSLLNLALILSGLLMFITFQIDQTKRLAQKESELDEMRIKTMISQIQPHFIANALTAIYFLIETDPPKAQECVHSFAKYLRNNINALESTSPIPFTQELEHIEEYLKIEKIRFGDRLNIEYDIQTEDFCVPSLSVQSMVENAVKHGVCKVTRGGTVRLSTRELPECFEVEISDNGAGFDVDETKLGGTHVGIANSRERVRMMCGGRLEVTSKVGEGTKITISLPKAQK